MNDRDSAALAERYADVGNLDAGIALHENYGVADADWWPWGLRPLRRLARRRGRPRRRLWYRFPLARERRSVPADWELLLTDFSPGMAAEARGTLADAGVDASIGVAAAESLPLSDDQRRVEPPRTSRVTPCDDGVRIGGRGRI